MSPARAFAALALLAAAATAAPATYDQRQEGDFNVRADVQNVVLLALIPSKIPPSAIDFLASSLKSSDRSVERRADQSDVLEAFVEPGTPYRVEIAGKSALSDVEADSDDSPLPIVIPVENDHYVTEERDAKVVEISGKRREDNALLDDNKAPVKVEDAPLPPPPLPVAEEPLKLLGALEQCGPGRTRDREGVCQEELIHA